MSDGSSDVTGQDGQRHLHRAASDNANTEANPNNGTGKILDLSINGEPSYFLLQNLLLHKI